MDFYATDTHALFWYLTASPKLGVNAKTAFDEGAKGNAVIYIPTIVLAELFFLNEKLNQPLDFNREFERFEQSAQFEFVGFAPENVKDFSQDSAVPEMHDRMIVGVARRLGVPCLTCDKEIVASRLVKVVW
ncbi:MAG: PIN domain-containing protein [Acidobacteriota bacterium]|jgi:PIN domain nuclease of toxin-antitoxin system|nr:PIN domain-containing protein [Acidobacteriota bacterium]